MGRHKRTRVPKAPARKSQQKKSLEEINRAIADNPMESQWFAVGDQMEPRPPKRERQE